MNSLLVVPTCKHKNDLALLKIQSLKNMFYSAHMCISIVGMSGGPVYKVQDDGRHVLVGVISGRARYTKCVSGEYEPLSCLFLSILCLL